MGCLPVAIDLRTGKSAGTQAYKSCVYSIQFYIVVRVH